MNIIWLRFSIFCHHYMYSLYPIASHISYLVFYYVISNIIKMVIFIQNDFITTLTLNQNYLFNPTFRKYSIWLGKEKVSIHSHVSFCGIICNSHFGERDIFFSHIHKSIVSFITLNILYKNYLYFNDIIYVRRGEIVKINS